MENSIACLECKGENPTGMKFCGQCGSPLHVSCINCGQANPPGFKFCGHCGHQIVEGEQESEKSAPERHAGGAQEGERRHLTVMFCDLVGSTELSQLLDPEDLRQIVLQYQSICRKIVARFEGHVAQYLGDGILVYFGYPKAHENDAHRAVTSALAIIEGIKQLNSSLDSYHNIQLAVRIGVHSGHIVIGNILQDTDRQQFLAHGAVLNIAARIQSFADPDSLVISESTLKLIERHFTVEDLGNYELRGLQTPINLFKVLHGNRAKSILDHAKSENVGAPIIGRQDEMEKLKDCWFRAKQGHSSVVLINGEAGVGKSKLVGSLLAHVAEDSEAWFLPHECSPYHRKTAYYPFAKTIKTRALQLSGGESEADIIARLEGFLIQYGLNLDEVLPLFAGWLSISLANSSYRPSPYSPEQQKKKITESLLSMMIQRAREQPVLMLFEDLHWIDDASLIVLDKLMQQSPSIQMLAILTYRPEFRPSWRLQPHIVPMTLTRLDEHATREIILSLTGGKPLPDHLTEQIIRKTDGIPLFVEELTKMILTSNLLMEEGERFNLTGSMESLAIPSTLHDSLIARLDQMTHTKKVAQLGAVIGRKFSYDLISSISDMNENSLQNTLDELVQAELLTQSGIIPDAEFSFRHALLRDAAYQSLLKSQQRSYHSSIAESLLKNFTEVVAKRPEVLAFHFEKAGLFAHSVEYWIQAAVIAEGHHVYQNALSALEKAITLIDQIDRGKEKDNLMLKVRALQGPIQVILHGWASKEAMLASMRLKQLSEKLGDQINLFKALRTINLLEIFSGYPEKAEKFALSALEISKNLEDQEFAVEARRMLGHTFIMTGKLRESIENFNVALEKLKSLPDDFSSNFIGGHPEVICLIQSSHVLWSLGLADQARVRADRALKLARENGQPYMLAMVIEIRSFLAIFMSEYQEALLYAKEAYSLSDKYGFEFFKESETFVGYANFKKGKHRQGLQQMHRSSNHRMKMNARIGNNLHRHLLISAYLEIGKLQEAEEEIQQCLALAIERGDQFLLPEIYRLQGEVYAKQQKPQKEVMACFAESLRLSVQQSSLALQLRANISIYKYNASTSMGRESLESLKKLYYSFTEGFDMADMKEALSLIEQQEVFASEKP